MPQMRALVASGARVQLALSLHATTDEVRDWIVPVNRRHNLAELMAAAEELFPTGQRDRRHLMIQYCMLQGTRARCALWSGAARCALPAARCGCLLRLATRALARADACQQPPPF